MSEPKTDRNKFDWTKRHTIDPMIVVFKWRSEIQVIPADAEKGEYNGTRIYPDGRRETFSVRHN